MKSNIGLKVSASLLSSYLFSSSSVAFSLLPESLLQIKVLNFSSALGTAVLVSGISSKMLVNGSSLLLLQLLNGARQNISWILRFQFQNIDLKFRMPKWHLCLSLFLRFGHTFFLELRMCCLQRPSYLPSSWVKRNFATRNKFVSSPLSLEELVSWRGETTLPKTGMMDAPLDSQGCWQEE